VQAFAAALPIPLPELTVGLYATLTSVACIIAADTGAYFVGKNLGRTKLTEISPKKTVEGALGGLASAIAVALLFWQLCRWPESWAAAAGYGVSRRSPNRHRGAAGRCNGQCDCHQGLAAAASYSRLYVCDMTVYEGVQGHHMPPLTPICLRVRVLLLLTQVVTFFSSIFGDLIESIMKRDAGMKVRGQLPGQQLHALHPAVLQLYAAFLTPTCIPQPVHGMP
jgi:CDP-diglyceride synthetase